MLLGHEAAHGYKTGRPTYSNFKSDITFISVIQRRDAGFRTICSDKDAKAFSVFLLQERNWRPIDYLNKIP